MDFMTPQSAMLVPYALTTVSDPQRMYVEAVTWAEPDVAFAAAALGYLVGDASARRTLGARARAQAEAAFDLPQWRARVLKQVSALTTRIATRSAWRKPDA